MNVLKNYCFRVDGYSYSNMKKILNDKHDVYKCIRKGPQLFMIHNINTNKLTNLKCISKTYTTDPKGKALKIAKNNGECFNTQLKFGIKARDCMDCHRQMLRLFEQNKINNIK